MTSTLPPLLQATAGAIGSATGNAIVFPFDLATVRMQHASIKKKLSLIQTLTRIINRQGLARLYSGLGADTLSTILSSFLYFLIYTSLERAQRLRHRIRGTKVTPAAAASTEILIGTIAGIASKRLALPISAVCIKQQLASDTDDSGSELDGNIEEQSGDGRNEKGEVQGRQGSARNPRSKRSPSVLSTLVQLKQEKGLLGLFHVPLATVPLALLPSLTLFFHDLILRLLPLSTGQRAHPPGSLTFLVAALSNALATIPLYPLVLAKTLSMSGADQSKNRLVGPLGKVYEREGVAGWFKGLEGQLVKGVIQQGVTMLLKQRIEEAVVAAYR